MDLIEAFHENSKFEKLIRKMYRSKEEVIGHSDAYKEKVLRQRLQKLLDFLDIFSARSLASLNLWNCYYVRKSLF